MRFLIVSYSLRSLADWWEPKNMKTDFLVKNRLFYKKVHWCWPLSATISNRAISEKISAQFASHSYSRHTSCTTRVSTLPTRKPQQYSANDQFRIDHVIYLSILHPVDRIESTRRTFQPLIRNFSFTINNRYYFHNHYYFIFFILLVSITSIIRPSFLKY